MLIKTSGMVVVDITDMKRTDMLHQLRIQIYTTQATLDMEIMHHHSSSLR